MEFDETVHQLLMFAMANILGLYQIRPNAQNLPI